MKEGESRRPKREPCWNPGVQSGFRFRDKATLNFGHWFPFQSGSPRRLDVAKSIGEAFAKVTAENAGKRHTKMGSQILSQDPWGPLSPSSSGILCPILPCPAPSPPMWRVSL